MGSDKPPLVLLHGITMSGNAWQEVVPLLSDHHEVFTPTALGHRRGPPVQRRPATITDVVDAAERTWTSVVWSDPILPETPWADLWPSSWPGAVVRPPSALFLRSSSGQPVSNREHSIDFNGA